MPGACAACHLMRLDTYADAPHACAVFPGAVFATVLGLTGAFVTGPPVALEPERQPTPRLINELSRCAGIDGIPIEEWAERCMDRIPMCPDAVDLDCLESVSVIRDGVRLPLTFIKEDPPEQSVSTGRSWWSYPGPEGETVTFFVNTSVVPVGARLPWGTQQPGVIIAVFRSADDDHPMRGWADLDCTTGRPEDCTVGHPALPSGDAVEIVLRMSWLKPLSGGASGRDLFYRKEAIAGGHRFTLRARQNLRAVVSNYQNAPVEEWTSPAWDADLHFIIDHAGKDRTESAYDPRCALHGAPIGASNAWAAGQPYWDPVEKSLNFNILGPHLGPDGRLYRGHFELRFPIAWLRCQVNDPRLRLNGFVVQVIDEDGEEQVATTSLKQRRGQVTLLAYNFHYSSPTVRMVKAKKS